MDILWRMVQEDAKVSDEIQSFASNTLKGMLELVSFSKLRGQYLERAVESIRNDRSVGNNCCFFAPLFILLISVRASVQMLRVIETIIRIGPIPGSCCVSLVSDVSPH